MVVSLSSTYRHFDLNQFFSGSVKLLNLSMGKTFSKLCLLIKIQLYYCFYVLEPV